MGLSTSVLYELIVLANLVVLAVTATIVVGLLRWSLRRWTSIWPKTIAIHVVNLIVALVGVPTVIRLFPTLWFAGLTVGSIVDFCFWLMLADGMRVWTKTQPALIRPAKGLIPLALFFAICGLAFLAARVSVSPGGRAALEEARLTASIYQSFAQQSPQREVVDAMRKAFPKELAAIMKPYVAQAARDAAHHAAFLPKFPIDKISGFLKSKSYDLVRAPDADLARFAKSLSGYGDFLARNHATCSIEPGGGVIMHIPDRNQPLRQTDSRAMGQLYAAQIFATRAGMDHPVDRDISDARVGEFNMLFRKSLPSNLQSSLDDLIVASYQPKACNIEVLTAHYRWIGTLPPADAADYLAAQLSGRYGLSLAVP
jgi:hypothetical protein